MDKQTEPVQTKSIPSNLDVQEFDVEEIDDRVSAALGLNQVIPDEDDNETSEDTLKANPDEQDAEEDSDTDESVDSLDSELVGAVASYLGIDADKLAPNHEGKLMVNAKVDGAVSQVPLSDVISSYQLQQHVNNKSTELGVQHQALEKLKADETTKITNQLLETQQLTKAIEEAIIGDYKQIDWNKLYSEDPEKSTMLQNDFNIKSKRLDEIKSSVQKTIEQFTQNQQAEALKAHQQMIQQQLDIVLKNNPTWADPVIRQAEVIAQGKFLQENYGFTSQELENVTDARIVELVKDAKAYKDLKIKQAQAKQNPKSGIKRPTQKLKGSNSSNKRLIANLKRTGSTQAAVDLLLKRL